MTEFEWRDVDSVSSLRHLASTDGRNTLCRQYPGCPEGRQLKRRGGTNSMVSPLLPKDAALGEERWSLEGKIMIEDRNNVGSSLIW